MQLSGESSTEIWELPLKTDDLKTCGKKRLISLTGKTDRGGQRREEYFLNTAPQPQAAKLFSEGHEENLCPSQEFNPDFLLGSLP